jgi:hypothetical protein
MILDCILVCVNYSDFLAHTLEENRGYFDNVMIVTEEHDENTIKVAKEHDCKITLTKRLHENGDPFNKAKALNDGFKNLNPKGWVVVTDADMVMPLMLRKKLEKMELNPEMIYGSSRYMCPTYEEWAEYKSNVERCKKWAHQRRRLAIGVGFFQLFNAKCKTLPEDFKWYNEGYKTAGRSDRAFLRTWPGDLRGNIQMPLIHLDNGNHEMGTNWSGRVTPLFGPQNEK